MVSDQRLRTIMFRPPKILDEVEAGDYGRMTELYDEADEWRDALRAYTQTPAPERN
jgi:hypothetical protein